MLATARQRQRGKELMALVQGIAGDGDAFKSVQERLLKQINGK